MKTLMKKQLFAFTLALMAYPCLQAQNPVDSKDYKGKPCEAALIPIPQRIPGKVYCAYYDTGGEGISYHETSESNLGSGKYNPADGRYLNEFRMNEGVDISYTKEEMDYTPKNTFNPPLGLLYIGWTDPGEWVNYTVLVRKTGTYKIQLLCSAAKDGAISLSIDGKDVTGTLGIPSTTSPHIWNLINNLAEVHLERGRHILTLHTKETGSMNYAWLDFYND
ncbi:MAG: carbohydrate-binding protein [Tannerellaceae bacterium]|jgi:hypothetical protein|nr:carbohydrate-binding protein [Tannerellaceae bacterium]